MGFGLACLISVDGVRHRISREIHLYNFAFGKNHSIAPRVKDSYGDGGSFKIPPALGLAAGMVSRVDVLEAPRQLKCCAGGRYLVNLEEVPASVCPQDDKSPEEVCRPPKDTWWKVYDLSGIATQPVRHHLRGAGTSSGGAEEWLPFWTFSKTDNERVCSMAVSAEDDLLITGTLV
jgi:hypothetical protein